MKHLTAAGTAAAIEAVGLYVGVEGHGLEDVHWRIRAGDYWVLGGAPGSGKSELLAALSGLHRPRKGCLKLFGRDAAESGPEDLLAARLRIGLVFENGGRPFNHLTVEQNVSLPLSYHQNLSVAEGAEYVRKLLDATELTPYSERVPGQIRPALRQRVAIARALVNGPEVLLLDSALAGLGPREVRWWLDFLDQLAAGNELTYGRSLTLVVTDNDLRPWPGHAKHFALLKQNRLLILGDQTELERSDEPLLRELLDQD